MKKKISQKMISDILTRKLNDNEKLLQTIFAAKNLLRLDEKLSVCCYRTGAYNAFSFIESIIKKSFTDIICVDKPNCTDTIISLSQDDIIELARDLRK